MPGENQITIFLTVTSILILLLAALIITLIYLYKKKQFDFEERIYALKSEHEKSVLAIQLEIQEETFQHISREIHDNIGLSLTLAKLTLNTLNLEDRSRTEQKIDSSVALISESIENLSHISTSLHSGVISEHGLMKALDNEVQRIREADLLKIEIEIKGEPIYLENQMELLIFRIVQEALNNIMKHANASKAWLLLEFATGELRLMILDDGRGFLVKNLIFPGQKDKAGLKNMELRTRMIGGKMEIESAPGKGTRLKFTLPI